jgi:hypothetical protein
MSAAASIADRQAHYFLTRHLLSALFRTKKGADGWVHAQAMIDFQGTSLTEKRQPVTDFF